MAEERHGVGMGAGPRHHPSDHSCLCAGGVRWGEAVCGVCVAYLLHEVHDVILIGLGPSEPLVLLSQLPHLLDQLLRHAHRLR